MGAADADRKIRWFDISFLPTTHDSPAFRYSNLGMKLYDDELPAPFFFNGDNAFSLHRSMMVPGVGMAWDDYNYVQSSARMPIEQAWGEVVRRWGVLWRPLSCEFNRRASVIAACIRLHNICVDHRIAVQYQEVNGLVYDSARKTWVRPPRFDRDGRPVQYLASRQLHQRYIPKFSRHYN